MIGKAGSENSIKADARNVAEKAEASLRQTSADQPARCSPAYGPDEQRLQELIGRIADHDQLAFSALYDVMVGRVYGLALRITRCVQLAEEVAEDTFWQIWRQAPRFDPARGSAAVWIMTIARSRALDTLRRMDTAECNNDPEASPDGVFSGGNPPDLLAALQDGALLHTALARLDPVPRQLLALAFFCGLSHEEIACHAGLPLGTVKSHIRRALITLRQTMAPDADS
jgi:RNA polymerase sigma-70 factor (ECF subfamily)